MTTSPRMSVVVPTRHRPAALQRCVAALRDQEPPEGGFEIVVVDDGDGLPELPSDVLTLRGGGDGPAAARNLGAGAAGGEVIAFTDDDCVPSSRWLLELDAGVRRRGTNVGVAGVTVNGLPDNAFAAASQLVLEASHEHFSADGEPRFAASCNLALPAAEFRALGGFDRSLRHAEDRDLCMRWLASGRRLLWAPRAEVIHQRGMDLTDFARQQAGYGRGAYALHRRVEGSGLAPTPQWSFYLTLAARIRNAPNRRVRLAALCAFSQAMTAGGFVLEAVATRWGLGRRTCTDPSIPIGARNAAKGVRR